MCFYRLMHWRMSCIALYKHASALYELPSILGTVAACPSQGGVIGWVPIITQEFNVVSKASSIGKHQ